MQCSRSLVLSSPLCNVCPIELMCFKVCFIIPDFVCRQVFFIHILDGFCDYKTYSICRYPGSFQNILVIKTVSGMAMAVAAALDAIHFSEIVGCIAGDDTVMCAVRTVDDTIVLMDKIRKLIAG